VGFERERKRGNIDLGLGAAMGDSEKKKERKIGF
jgi:hypothetical protein